MLYFLLIILFILALPVLKWGLSPYFTWRALVEKPVTDTFTIVTKEGREPLAEYINRKRRERAPLDYTILVPAYNEAKRLPNMIPKAIDHFENMKYKYEIIVISDASKDKTTEVALQYSIHNGKKVDIKVLEYTVNQGKGGAVRTGVMASFGDGILMVDADGASDIRDFEKLSKKLKEIEIDGHGLAAGSRAVLDENSVQERTGVRLFLSMVSNFIIQTICGVKLKDTQCGFKLFTNKSAKSMFRTMHIRRWAFDVELFMIANEKKIPYAEVWHNYQDQDDSKLNVVTDSIQMARDFLLIRIFYLLKLWKRTHTDKIWETFLPSTTTDENDSPKRTGSSSPRKTKRE